MQELLIEAIRDRRTLTVRYANVEAKVEPHAYGHDFRGQPVLLCYLTGVATEAGSGWDAGWKLLPLNRATTVADTGERFSGARPGYRRGHGDLCAPVACL